MNRSLRCLLLAMVMALHVASAEAQTPAPGAAAGLAAPGESLPLPARTVATSVGVSATLLTHDAISRLFGKEIANTYAVVQLTIANRNPDAAFVLHSAYLDISNWALGGASRPRDQVALQPYQAATRAYQIASVESRVARGQLLDAQMWSKRNWTVRILTTVGAVAAASVFTGGEDAAKAVAAFNGTVVPGVAFAWPDGSVGQLNRMSDFGFQTNKVIPKESADVVVCFFPLDLFLSPGIKPIFSKSPALFLSPYQVLFTSENAYARKAMGLPVDLQDKKLQDAVGVHACYSKGTQTSEDDAETKAIKSACETVLKAHPESVALLDYIGRFGVENIPVVVDGVMTLELDAVPAAIDSVTFDGDAATPAFWASGAHKVTLECRYCGNGLVAITEGATLGISDVKVVGEESTDHKLVASFKLTKPVDTGSTLHFVITKPSVDPKKADGVKSAPFAYTVSYLPVAPQVTDVSVDGKKVTLTGTGFDHTASHPFTLALSREGGLASDKAIAWPADAKSTSVSFTAPDGLAPGCWHPTMTWAANAVSVPDTKKSQRFLVAPSPTMTAAKRGSDNIAVTGTQLADTSMCADKPVAFELVNADDKTKAPISVKATFDSKDFTSVALEAPAAVKTGNWLVRIVGTEVTTPLK